MWGVAIVSYMVAAGLAPTATYWVTDRAIDAVWLVGGTLTSIGARAAGVAWAYATTPTSDPALTSAPAGEPAPVPGCGCGRPACVRSKEAAAS